MLLLLLHLLYIKCQLKLIYLTFLINSYLGKKKVNVGIFNHEKMDPELAKKYETEEQKDPVILDKENLTDIEIIEDDLITDEDGVFRHDTIRLGLDIFSYLLNQKK